MAVEHHPLQGEWEILFEGELPVAAGAPRQRVTLSRPTWGPLIAAVHEAPDATTVLALVHAAGANTWTDVRTEVARHTPHLDAPLIDDLLRGFPVVARVLADSAALTPALAAHLATHLLERNARYAADDEMVVTDSLAALLDRGLVTLRDPALRPLVRALADAHPRHRPARERLATVVARTPAAPGVLVALALTALRRASPHRLRADLALHPKAGPRSRRLALATCDDDLVERLLDDPRTLADPEVAVHLPRALRRLRYPAGPTRRWLAHLAATDPAALRRTLRHWLRRGSLVALDLLEHPSIAPLAPTLVRRRDLLPFLGHGTRSVRLAATRLAGRLP